MSTPEPDNNLWNGNSLTEINRLPPPSESFETRIPSPLPEQSHQNKDEINLNYVIISLFIFFYFHCNLKLMNIYLKK